MPKIQQIEPSYDDLAFEPEMTWKELVEKAKELGWKTWSNCNGVYALNKGELIFSVGGAFYICIEFTANPYHIFAENRTYKQMYQIMLALED